MPRSHTLNIRVLALAALLAVALMPASLASAQSPDAEPPRVTLRIVGQKVMLPDDLRQDLRDRADKIVRRCGYDGGDQPIQVWKDALAAPSHIHLSYASPIGLQLPRREIPISEALFLIEDQSFLNQPLLHHDGRTTAVFKCDGPDMLSLMCLPGLAAYFPPGYQDNCDVLN